MMVLVTGATGFTGSHVVPLLLKNDHEVRCLVRPTSDISSLPKGVSAVTGDLSDPSAMEKAMIGLDALVNIASIGLGHAQGIVAAAEASGIQRAVFISTTAIFTALNAPSKAIRHEAESSITSSGLEYTILRPTMIYGSARDRNMCRLIRYLQKWPAIPVFGSGENLQQPLYVGDLAATIVDALSKDQSARKSYNLAGAKALAYNQVIETICGLLGRSVLRIHLPAMPMVAILRSVEKMSITLPIKAEQILRLNEDKVFDYRDAARDLGFQPRSFSEGIALELKEMGIIKD